ncbi:hypothetical protein A2U01_0076954, partial [Trifolium medium]|nr:hypothetical protein [Trifolium medium]
MKSKSSNTKEPNREQTENTSSPPPRKILLATEERRKNNPKALKAETAETGIQTRGC